MAARLRPHHQDEIRNKIQTSQLINRLTSYALNSVENEEEGKGAPELSAGQLKAIEILLKKSLPDLSSVVLAGDPNAPLQNVTRVELVGVRAD